MPVNHEVKNNENDTPGFLISKFSNDGRVRIRATPEDDKKLSLDFYIENKDLFAHLLKPSVPFNLSLVNIRWNFGGNTNVICPCVFPDGIIDSITIPNSNVNNIRRFEIACYGNTKNQFIGSTKWFYVNSNQLTPNETGTYKYINSDDRKAIVPYSYNFICIKIDGTELSCRSIEDFAQEALLNHDMQYKFYGDLNTLDNITESSIGDKMTAEYIPYFQINIVKGV